MENDKINFEIEVKSALIKENRTMSNLAEEIGHTLVKLLNDMHMIKSMPIKLHRNSLYR